MSKRLCEGCGGGCAHCTGSMRGKRSDARFCCRKCYWPAYTQERLQQLQGREGAPRRASRDGCGTRMYLTSADLHELLAEPAILSPHMYRKVIEAKLRVEGKVP